MIRTETWIRPADYAKAPDQPTDESAPESPPEEVRTGGVRETVPKARPDNGGQPGEAERLHKLPDREA